MIIEQGKPLADYFEELCRVSGAPKMAANWVQQDVLRTLNERRCSIAEFPISAEALGALIGKVQAGQINTHSAREVFAEMLSGGKSADEIIQSRGLTQISDTDEIRKVVVAVIDANPSPDYS